MDGRDKPGHDAAEGVVLTKRKSLALLAVALIIAAIVFASLAPVGWQMRFGLHWLVEHFLVFFALTMLVCLVWPRALADKTDAADSDRHNLNSASDETAIRIPGRKSCGGALSP